MATSNFNTSGYPYTFIMRRVENGQPCLMYRFKSSKTRQMYIVRVEEYPYHFYGIKFYLKAHALSPQKYNILTGLNEPRAIINTCLHILVDIYHKDKRASFGFIGAETILEMEERKRTGVEKLTKRMSFYRRMINSYFPENDDYFIHYIDESKSTYLIVNKMELSTDNTLIDKINRYFTENYTNFD